MYIKKKKKERNKKKKMELHQQLLSAAGSSSSQPPSLKYIRWESRQMIQPEKRSNPSRLLSY